MARPIKKIIQPIKMDIKDMTKSMIKSNLDKQTIKPVKTQEPRKNKL